MSVSILINNTQIPTKIDHVIVLKLQIDVKIDYIYAHNYDIHIKFDHSFVWILKDINSKESYRLIYFSKYCLSFGYIYESLGRLLKFTIDFDNDMFSSWACLFGFIVVC